MADDVPHTQPAPAPKNLFRTYAKDAATLGGQITDIPSTVAPARPAPNLQKETEKPAPQVVETPAPKVQAPEPELPPAHIIPKAPNTNETRESVLARLRTKVGGAVSIPEPEKQTNVSREAVLARLKSKAESAPPVSKVAQAPSPIHTYKTDFSDRTKKTGASRISVLAKEQDAHTQAPQVVHPPHRSRHLVAIGVSLIVLGAGSIVIAYRLVTGTPVLPPTLSVPSLILPNAREEIAGESMQLQQALVALEDKNTVDGEVIVAYVTHASTTANGTTINVPATGGDVIVAMDLPAPSIVLRNVSPESTVGVVRAGGESRPFFILRVDSYERTFAGMLSWEASIQRDLAFFYPPYPQVQTLGGGSTTTPATSTPLIAYTPRFTDQIIQNHDTRVLKDSAGRILILYGYYDKQTLVIARNEMAFAELVTRLQSVRAR